MHKNPPNMEKVCGSSNSWAD